MASTYTTNKKLEQPANNDYVGNWNLPVNADWSTIDTCFGGYQVLNPTSLSGTVALTSSTSGTQPYTTTAQWQSPNIVIGTSLTGVATLTASINYQLPSGIGGIWSIYNNTTGAFTVTFSSAGGGSSVVLPQGYRIKVVSDGTNVQVAQTSSTSFALSSALRFLGATSGYMGFQGPATGNNTTWTLPGTDGSAGQVLSTNGSATLSWASVPAVASALTAGSVLFANASGQIAQNNAQFYWDSTNNRLGIGTTSPSQPLEVQAANSVVISTGTAGYGSFYAKGSGTNNSYLFMGNVTNGEQGRISAFDTGIIAFSNTPSAIERMRIDGSGNLGLNRAPTGVAGYLFFEQQVNATNGGGYRLYNSSGVETFRLSTDGAGTVATLNAIANVPMVFDTNNTERMRIGTTGNVAIGTTDTTTARLYVRDTTNLPIYVATNYASTAFIALRNENTGGDIGISLSSSSTWTTAKSTGQLRYDGLTSTGAYTEYAGIHAASGNNSSTGAPTSLLFLTSDGTASSVVRMTIDNSGNLGLNRTTANPYGYLFFEQQVNATYGGGYRLYNSSGVETFRLSTDGAGSFVALNAIANVPMVFDTNNTERMRIAASGEIYMAAAQSPTQTYNVGYLGLPQNNPGTNYTGVLSDAGKSIIMGNALTFTIPANSSVAYPIGTTLTIVNSAGGAGQNCTIAITTDTMYLANTTSTPGSRTLAPLGIATAYKIYSTVWIISGVGLS